MRDDWLIATSPEAEREYIIHTRAPRFIARIITDDDDADIDGVTYACATGETFCEVVWIDPAPQDEQTLRETFQGAETALAIYTADSFEDE